MKNPYEPSWFDAASSKSTSALGGLNHWVNEGFIGFGAQMRSVIDQFQADELHSSFHLCHYIIIFRRCTGLVHPLMVWELCPLHEGCNLMRSLDWMDNVFWTNTDMNQES